MNTNQNIDQQLIALFNRQQYGEVVQLAKRAVEKDPNYAFGWKAIGTAAYLLKDYANALSPLKKAIELNPNDLTVYNNLAVVLRGIGRLEEAEEHYRKVLALKPDYIDAYNNLGVTLFDLGKLDEAVQSYTKAIAMKPDYAEAHYNLGNALKKLGIGDDAAACYTKAIACKPDYAEAYNNLGLVLKNLGQFDEAVKNYTKAITHQPDYAEAYHNLGLALIDLGKLDEAVESHTKAVAIRPDYADAHRALSTLLKYTQETPHLQQLLGSYHREERRHAKALLGFALAKAYEDMKDYDRSFHYLEEANRLKFEESEYSIEKQKNQFKQIASLFENKRAGITSEQVDSQKKRPIFILGMPRSGTTLTEQILSSHSFVHACGELAFLGNVSSKYILSNFQDSSLNSAFAKIYDDYIHGIEKLNFKEAVFTDKMPHNFIYIGFILEAFPNAKIIHMQRHPMATCWSMYKTFFPAKGLEYSYDFDALAEFHKFYKSVMDFWNEKYPGKIYNLQYENLTENQEDETRKLLAYCELPWEDSVLEPHQNKRAVSTASSQQVRKKVYKGSSEAWKKFATHLEPLKTQLSEFL